MTSWQKTFKRVSARGRAVRRTPGEMNGTERAYLAEVIEPRLLAGEIAAWWFEAFTFKLAKDTRYTPDFVWQLADGTLEVVEIKGHWEEDAKVKIKVAAQLLPFRFIAVRRVPKKEGGGWSEQEF